jgi:hypothetical protein
MRNTPVSAEETSFFPADPQWSNAAATHNEGLRPGVAREAGAFD